MSEPTSVSAGAEPTLAVSARDAPDGTAVTFEIRAGQDVLATLQGTTTGGKAQVKWRVDVGSRALPVDLTFVASAQGQQLESGALRVVPRALLGAIEWTRPGARPTGAPQLPLLDTGEQVALHVAVTADAPVDVEMRWETFDGDHADQPGTPLAGAPPFGDQHGVSGTARDLTTAWTAAPLSRELIRVAVRLLRGGRELARGASPGVLVYDKLDVTFEDPDWVAPVARESSPRDWLTFDAASQTWTSSPAGSWKPWELTNGAVLDEHGTRVAVCALDPSGTGQMRVVAGSKGTFRVVARRFLSGVAPLEYATIGGGAATFGTPQHAKIVTRCRSSIWAEPAYFMVSKSDPKFSDVRLSTFPQGGGLLDDITVLNALEIALDHGELRVKLALADDFASRVVKACHARSIQVLADLTAIEKFKLVEKDGRRVESDEPGDAGGRRFMDLVRNRKLPDRPSFLNQKSPDLKGAAKAFVDAITRLGFDGIEMDVEDGLRGTWPADAVANFRRLMGEIAAQLAPTNRFLGIANGGLVAPGRLGTGSSTVPAEGSAGAQPFELAHEGSNIIMRPMGYDNGVGKQRFKEDAPVPGREGMLRALHTRIIDYALTPKSQGGAGLSPGQFQLGVKIFVPYGPTDATGKTPETGQGGEIRGGSSEMATTCREVLRPRRVGIIQFAHGAGSDKDFTVKNNFEPVNRALNHTGADRDPPAGGVRTLPGGAIGQPAQCPLDDIALARLKDS